MDKLVKPDLQELCVPFTKGQKCSATFKLTNVMHTMAVAVSLTTTDPSVFSISNPFSIIPPLSTSTYTLFLSRNSDSSDQPPVRSPLDTVLVRTSMLPTGKANQDHLRRLFSKPGPHIFRDAKIPISLVGPEVVEFLILSPARKSLEVAFLLSKAIFWCDRGQLNSLLMCAAKNGNAYYVSALVEAGADVNSRDPETKQSAMTLAIEGGHIDAVQVLIEAGYELDSSVDLFLHNAAAMERQDLLEILCLGYGDIIDSNSVDSWGRTALHLAAIQGNLGVIQFLVSSGSDPDIVDCKGWSPLHYATEEGHAEAVEFLLDHSIWAKYAIGRDGKTAFDIAVEEGHSYLFNMLDSGEDLHSAATKGDIEAIKNCLEETGSGAANKVNSRDQNGWTPLHRAAFKGRIECVKALISHGAELDLVNDSGYSPLHLAVESGHMKIATFLLAHGAKSNLKSLKAVVPHELDSSPKSKNHSSGLLNPCYQGKEIA